MKKDKKSIGIIISGIVIMIITVVIFCFLQNSAIMVAGIFVGVVFEVVGIINNDIYTKNQEHITFLNGEIYIYEEIKDYKKIGTHDEEKKEIYTHDHWKNSIVERYTFKSDNYKNEFFRCLIRGYRDAKTSGEIMKAIVLPAELGIVACVGDKTKTIGEAVLAVAILSVVIIILFVIEVYDSDIKMAFIKDTIEAIYGKEKLNDLELLG